VLPCSLDPVDTLWPSSLYPEPTVAQPTRVLTPRRWSLRSCCPWGRELIARGGCQPRRVENNHRLRDWAARRRLAHYSFLPSDVSRLVTDGTLDAMIFSYRPHAVFDARDYPSIRAQPVAPYSLTVWRRVSHRALRCGPPACAGKARRRHGWRERPCMQRRFPAASCRLPAQGPGRRGSTNCVCCQRILQSSWAGARVVALERLASLP